MLQSKDIEWIHHRADSKSKKNYNPTVFGVKTTFTERMTK